VHREIVAIFGSGGQLGVELRKEFAARGYEVAAFARGTVDILDSARVETALAQCNASIVINSAAYNNVDVAEEEPLAAYQVNGLAVRNLSMACRQCHARLVHFSTDYVFDGLAGRAYTEEDRPRPLGAYGVSKLSGEYYASAYLDDALVIRTCGVFGPVAKKNFVETMLALGQKGGVIRVTEKVASPTFAPALAARTADLVERKISGIIHAGGGTPISWLDWAAMIFQAAGMNPTLRPADEREFRAVARRPKYSALSNGKLESLGIAPMPRLEDAIRTYLNMRAGKSAPQS